MRRSMMTGFLLLALAGAGSVGWWTGRTQAAAERADVRRELVAQLGRDQELVRICFDDMSNQFTPGYRAYQVFIDPANPPVSQAQGKIFKVQQKTHAAINGDGFFILQDKDERLYTRDGRFYLGPDGLKLGGATVLGYKIDSQGRRESKLTPINPPLPETPMFDMNPEKIFTFNDDGVLTNRSRNGEERELYQVALAGFPNPEKLERKGLTTFAETAGVGERVEGVSRAQGLGQFVPASLELSNVDWMETAYVIGALKHHSGLLMGDDDETLSRPRTAPRLSSTSSPFVSEAVTAALTKEADPLTP